MDKLNLDLGAINGEVSVAVIKKNVKNVSLKVYPDFTIKVTVPEIVSDDWLEKFIASKSDWINKQLLKFKQSSGHNANENLKSGTSTQLLGKDLRIYKKVSLHNEVVLDEKVLTVYLTDVHNEDKFNALFEKFWRSKCKEIFEQETDFCYARIFKKHGLDKPDVFVRKMKTMWGSCNKTKKKITYNEYLLKADIRCIQYVVLHELTHLLYSYHNNDFYMFLTIHMPDWKERKKQLDVDIVQGL